MTWRFWEQANENSHAPVPTSDVEAPNDTFRGPRQPQGARPRVQRREEEEDFQDFAEAAGNQHPAIPSVLFSLVFILIVFNALPPGFALFFLASLILLTCLRAARVHASEVERQQLAAHLPRSQEMSNRADIGGLLQILQSQGQVMVLGRNGLHHLPPLRIQPGTAEEGGEEVAHASNTAELEALIMSTLTQQMQMIQRSGAPGPSAGTPVTDEDMAMLPTFKYRHAPTAGAEASAPAQPPGQTPEPSPPLHNSTDGQEHVAFGKGGRNAGELPAEGSDSTASGAAAAPQLHSDSDSELTCPICIEPVQEGEEVLTLPCLHQFHSHCVQPWLRQQGKNLAKCPMCKTPVWQA